MAAAADRAELRDAELAILNAPFDEQGWKRATEGIAHATRSSGAHLLGLGGPLLMPLNVVVGNYAGYEAYFANPALHGQSNWRVGTTMAPLEIQHEPDYAAYRRSHDTSDYDDAVSDLDIPNGCQSALLLDRNSLLGIATLRSRRDGVCRAETLQAFEVLRRQLARAIRMQIALDGEAAELMVGDMGALNSATILLDRHGSLCSLTSSAEQLLEEDGPIELDGLAVRLRNKNEDRSFQQALGRLLRSDGLRDVVVHQARVSCRALQRRWNLFAVRLPDREHSLGFEPHLSISLKPAA